MLNPERTTPLRVEATRIVAALFLVFSTVSCSFLKLDKNTNCLNESAGCFKADNTAPEYRSSTPIANALVSRLTTLTVVFSEELKDPKPADVKITGGGKGQLTLSSITKTAANTYTLSFSPDTVSTGPILIDFTDLVDYNNNKVNYSLALTGNVDIEIEFDDNRTGTNPGYRKGVSDGGGYTTTDIKWRHAYQTDPNNNWDMRVTTGAVDCAAGTSIFTGTGLADATDVLRTLDRQTHFPAGPGRYRVVVCITNAAMNKKGTNSVEIIRDDTPPTAIHSPVSDDYNTTKTMTVACSDNDDKIAIQQAQLSPWDGNLVNPANPADPDFDASGAVSVGTLLTAGYPINNPTNPTRTKVKYRCLDIAGNKSLVGMATYLVDTTLPEVAVNLDTSFRQFVSVTGYTTTTLNFTTNQSNTTYRIVKNATSCAAVDGDELSTGSTTPPPGPIVINASALDVGVNNIRVCVSNVGATKWGAASLQITRDDTVPFVTPSVTTGTYGAVQVVNLTCSPNADKVAITDAVLAGSTPPTPPSDPNIDANGIILLGKQQDQFITPDASVSTIKWQCITKSGNRSVVDGTTTATYTVDAILPTVTIIGNTRNFVSNLVGAHNFTNLTFQVSRPGLNYEIKSGSTNCSGGTTLATGTVATAGQDITVRLNTPFAGPPNHFGAVGSYDLKICVPNFIGALGYSTSSLLVQREDSRPNTVANVTVTSATSTSVTLGWDTTTDVGPAGIAGYRILQTTTQGNYSSPTTYTSNTNSVNISGLNPTITYYFVVRAVDSAGNVAITDSNEVQSRLALSVTVAGYSSALNGPFRVQLGSGEILSFTANGTQTFSQVFLSGDTYALPIIAQPATQNCAFAGNQYGTMNASLALSVTCVSGYTSGGSLIANKPAPLNYLLYRGNAQIIAGGGAGTSCGSTCNDGTGTNARFSNPYGMAMVNGFLYIADRENHRIRRIDTTVTPASTTTFAGSGTDLTSDGTGTGASFNAPQAITTDGVNLYVVESPAAGQGHLRKIHIATGQVTTLAGGGTQSGGTNCPVTFQGGCIDGRGAQVAFGGANGIVYHDGYLYITEYTNNRVRRMNLATGVVDTIAGDGQPQSATSTTGTNAQFNGATGAAVAGGVLYVADFNGHRIRAVSLTAPFAVTAVAGTGDPGHADGPLATARFYNPDHLTTDGFNLFVTEYSGDGNTGRRLRRIDLRKGRVSTIAGNSIAADTSGTGVAASFYSPVGIASDGRQLFVGTYDGGRIFRVTDSGLVGYWPLHGAVNDYASDVATPQDGTIQDSDTIANLLPTTGRYGESSGAYVFDGNNDVISASATNLPVGNSTRTLCAWVKFNGPQSGNDGVVGYGRRGVDDNGFGLAVENGLDMKIFVHTNDVAFNRPVENDIWSHACILRDSSTGELRSYVNGRLITLKSGSLSTPVSSKLCIGSRLNNVVTSCSADFFFAGSVADVRLYNRALNEGEINELAQDATDNTAVTGTSYNTGPTGLLAHYPMTPTAPLQGEGPLGGALTISAGTPALRVGKDGDTSGAFGYSGVAAHSASGAGLPLGTSPRTVCAWVKPYNYPSDGNRKDILRFGSGVNGNFGLIMYNASGSQRVGIVTVGNDFIDAQYALPLNAWSHLCANLTASGGAEVYVNALRVGNLASLGTSTGSGGLLIGGDGVTVDDVRIYNNALSSPQVRQLATQVPAGLVFRMDTVGDANDASGHNHALVSNTGALAAGRHGVANTAYRFTSGQLATYAHNTTLNTPNMTWSFWMKSPSMTGGDLNTSIIRKFQTFNADGWVVKYDHINYLHNYKASSNIMSAHESFVNNVWTHYTVVRSANGASDSIYINGQAAANTTGLGSNIVNTAQMLIGANGMGDITLQDVRIYNRVLDQAEVQALSGYHPDHGVAGMVFHVQADNYSHLADGALITTNWQDSTINDRYTLTGGVPTGSPKFVSGSSSLLGKKPAIEFDGVDGKYFDFGNTSVTYNGLTVCAALTRRGLGFRGLVEKRGGFQANSWGMITENAANAMKFEIGDPPGANVVDTVTDDSPSIYCMVNGAGNAIQTFVNGQLASTVGGSTLIGSNTRPLLVGARYDYAGSYHGQIGDIVIAVKDASTAERRVTECYLSSKYSIPLTAGAVCP
ncbi:LamG-like jellyroll fold domain-containing protein [Turneriella parva]|uniref:Fibronectin type III domain protein n=1 Tax=Turneriella parva (strain ATCC BAA-1111 / DSM 21527 / NCTC 11395 / H) TaxID=869212 RepID=I4B6D2_TURPD|nr:LamG-like jellyroll fold domain-containing protein [Turneriella parva]AFM12839.1 Fibronectin type III domain protein [Turneriella parva DSM 21527]